MSESIVWLHGDSLSATDPALRANPDAPAVFVFDEDLLATYGLTFKRLFFIYECVAEAIAAHPGGGEIRRGAVPGEVLAFAREQDAGRIHVTATDAPRFGRYRTELRQTLPVELYEVTPLVEFSGQARRFSQLWREIEEEALSFTPGEG